MRRGQALSIGSSEQCDFTIGSEGSPRFLRIFSWTGRPRGFTSLNTCRAVCCSRAALAIWPATSQDDRARTRSARQARHRHVALLFQLVVEPPRPARPQLPLSLKSRPIEVDWLTTIVGALSFLLHFGVVGTLYSDWADPVLDEGLLISGLVDAVALPPPPEVEQSESTEHSAATTATASPNPQPAPSSRDSGQRSANRNTAARLKPHWAASSKPLAFETIGSLSREGAATRDVLRDGELPTGPLDEAARNARGISGSPEIWRCEAAGPFPPGARKRPASSTSATRGAPSERTPVISNGRADRRAA